MEPMAADEGVEAGETDGARRYDSGRGGAEYGLGIGPAEVLGALPWVDFASSSRPTKFCSAAQSLARRSGAGRPMSWWDQALLSVGTPGAEWKRCM